jgi:predicted metal-dependent phosphoesterase TrpH
MIDLHTHSTCSDGTDPPARIPELAKTAGCSAVALTDHDTFAGLDEALARARELGVELVPGCEVSCAYRGKSAHVLVYLMSHEGGPFHDELVRLREDRVARNRRMVRLLEDLGLPITYDEWVSRAGREESAGRPHLALLLVEKGLAESVQDAFDRWLASGRPAYVSKARVPPADIITLARASGGVAVLAHPLSLGLEPSELASAVKELAGAGLTGIEAIYGRYTPDERHGLMQLAARLDLVATGGSDYHGTVKPDLAVGTGRGDLKVPNDVLSRLLARRPG